VGIGNVERFNRVASRIGSVTKVAAPDGLRAENGERLEGWDVVLTPRLSKGRRDGRDRCLVQPRGGSVYPIHLRL
jgi:hypothetical protein